MASLPEYYLIRLDPPPKSIGVTQNRRDNYRWVYNGQDSHCSHRCEISFLQEGSVRVNRIDNTVVHKEGSVRTVVIDAYREEVSITPVVQEFYTRFFLKEPPRPITEEEAAEWLNTTHEAILPAYTADRAVCEQISTQLKTMAALTKGPALARSLKLRSCLYECFAVLTEYAVTTARTNLQHLHRDMSPHTEKACRFLEDNLAQAPTVMAVAEHVGISYDYLKKVFQKDMNMTMTEYANRARIRRVEQLITVENMTLEAAGNIVGIDNPKYLSRMFHRYAGVSAAEYPRVYRERRSRTWPSSQSHPQVEP